MPSTYNLAKNQSTKDRSIEITPTEMSRGQKKGGKKTTDKIIKELWNNTKLSNIHTFGVSKGREKELRKNVWRNNG